MNNTIEHLEDFKYEVTIEEAQVKDKEKIKNLFQFYLHDLSEFAETLNINSQGKFENNDVDIFFEMENAISMTINIGDEVIGFMFIIKGKTVDYIINDIFILRKYRSKSIGKMVINKLFELYPGKYGLIILAKNKPAIKFWKSVYDENNIEYEENEAIYDDEVGVSHRFTIR